MDEKWAGACNGMKCKRDTAERCMGRVVIAPMGSCAIAAAAGKINVRRGPVCV